MAQTLFKEVTYDLSFLIQQIGMGQVGLPDLQRPFVWPNKKVRDLFDSMYRGYPVGYLLFWQNGAAAHATDAASEHKQIGTDRKQKVPNLLVIDGQQRLTSLFAVLRGTRVVRESFSEERIEIAFCPLDGTFEVADAAIRKDPTFLPDISRVWASDADIFEVAEGYLETLAATREVTADEKKAIRNAIQRLNSLTSFPFTALELSGTIDEEQVAEVFVRINSKGTPLNQADFILTLMSVFREEERRKLEEFCRQTRIPTAGKPSPFNHFIEPDPDHLLRVGVGFGFRRARLEHVYSILRGKALETGEFSEERREQQFAVLEKAQERTLDLQNWHEFLKVLIRAGFRGKQLISSRNALLYTYTFFLIGRHDYGVEPYTLRNAIARWFFFVALTGRYTSSPETRMEQDLADLRDIEAREGFLEHLDERIGATFTPDYWEITLPSELATSSARSPALFGYYAALNLLDARVLFSKMKVSELMDPAAKARKSALERHHLFPKGYLRKLGIRARREVNQIANYALLEWPDNIKISDESPADYFPRFFKRHTSEDEAASMRFWHALPDGWEHMEYAAFLVERRKLLAQVIRAGFALLRKDEVAGAEAVAAEPVREEGVGATAAAVLEQLPEGVREVFQDLLFERLGEPQAIEAQIHEHLDHLEELAITEELLDLDTARVVGERCLRLLHRLPAEATEEHLRLVHAAALYFILDDDGLSDTGSVIGFDDDLDVVAAVDRVLGAQAVGAS